MSILTYILGLPLLAAVLLVFVPGNYRVIIRAIALAATFVPMVLAIKMFCQFATVHTGYQFEQQIPWVESLGMSYHVGVDGLNVDVEQLAIGDIPAYGLFVGRLREALRVAIPKGQVSVATTANEGGAAMAAAASVAGADRVFVMGYDYRVAGSAPGASAPLDRHDGVKDLPWSLDLYRAAGVPVERTILGLPLYGMAWPVVSPEQGAAATGRGAIWIPRRNLDLLTGAAPAPTYDPVESVDFLAVPDGAGWRAIYLDTPTSLTPKLRLANDRGLAGAGFWAIGYERGLPEYTRLIERFRTDKLPAVETAAESTPGFAAPTLPAAPSP